MKEPAFVIEEEEKRPQRKICVPEDELKRLRAQVAEAREALEGIADLETSEADQEKYWEGSSMMPEIIAADTRVARAWLKKWGKR